LENGNIEVARRDEKTKEVVAFDGVDAYIEELLKAIQVNLLERAKKYRAENTQTVETYEEFKLKLEQEGGFFLAHWDGTKETEAKVKEETKATIRCIPFDQVKEEGKCMVTGKPSVGRVIFAKAY